MSSVSPINIMRHESIFRPSEHPYPVHIIGAGATGSHVFAALVNLGITNISVYDFDVVEEHNLANQIYIGADVGTPKVHACGEYYKRKIGADSLPEDMQLYFDKVTRDFVSSQCALEGGVVFLMTDTMESRREIFNALLKRNREIAAVKDGTPTITIIETRMASTHGAVYTINPFDSAQCKKWLSTLVDDTDTDAIELSPCGTALSVGPTANIIANYAVWQMISFFTDPLGVTPKIELFFKPTLTATSSDLAA